MRPRHSEHSQLSVYSILSCVRARVTRDSLKSHLDEGRVTYDFTLHSRVHDHTTRFWRCVGTAFRHFLSDSQNFMVTTLGSCVKQALFILRKVHINITKPTSVGTHTIIKIHNNVTGNYQYSIEYSSHRDRV